MIFVGVWDVTYDYAKVNICRVFFILRIMMTGCFAITKHEGDTDISTINLLR